MYQYVSEDTYISMYAGIHTSVQNTVLVQEVVPFHFGNKEKGS